MRLTLNSQCFQALQDGFIYVSDQTITNFDHVTTSKRLNVGLPDPLAFFNGCI